MSLSMFANRCLTLLHKGARLDTVTKIVSCNAATGKKGTTKNTHRAARNRRRGWKVMDGDVVGKGYVLARQIHKFRWLPGANVITGRRMTFTAACTGTVRFTKEIFIPAQGTELAKTVCTFPKGAFLYKTTINIIPPNDTGRFRLVETI